MIMIVALSLNLYFIIWLCDKRYVNKLALINCTFNLMLPQNYTKI